METEMRSRTLFERMPLFILMALGFLMPFFFIPNALVNISAAKGALLFVCVSLLAIFAVLSSLKKGTVSVPRTWLIPSFIFLGLVYFIASVFSGNPQVSLIGSGFTTDSFISVFAAVLLVLLVPSVVRTKHNMLAVYVSIAAGFLVLALIQIIRLFAGPDVLTLSVLFSPTATLLGKWNDLSIFSGFVLLLSVLTLEMLKVNSRMKIVLYVLSLLSLFIVAVVQFTPVWYVIGIFFLLLVLYKLSVKTASIHQGLSSNVVPLLTVVVVIIATIFIVAGSPLETALTDYFNTVQVEVRPSLDATVQVARGVAGDNPLFGVGPNRFSEAWFLYKPDGVNLTAFWAVPFTMGIGFLPSSFITVGALGFLGWVVALGLLLYLGGKAIFKKQEDERSQYYVLSSFLSALYLWVFLVIYTPGITLFALTFLFTGMFLAVLQHVGIIRFWTFGFSEHALHNFAGALTAVVLLIIVGVGGYAAITRFVAGVLHQRGVVQAQAGNLDIAARSVTRALGFSEQAGFYRTLAEIQTGQLAQVLQQGNVGPEVLRAQFQSQLSETLTSAQRATAVGGESYQNWLTLGRIYEELVPVGVDGAYENALSNYETALNFNPNGPDIYLALARLEARNGNNEVARERIREALEAKPNYTDAVFLLSQIDVAEGNVSSAINSVEAATLVEPNNELLFFQLGLLKYSTNDFEGARSAFETAVAINSVYANAKYFLGLSYDQLGRRSDAIVQFEGVLQLNPNNQEVLFILDNLKNDREPFANVQPPLDDEPENREELPADEPVVDE